MIVIIVFGVESYVFVLILCEYVCGVCVCLMCVDDKWYAARRVLRVIFREIFVFIEYVYEVCECDGDD